MKETLRLHYAPDNASGIVRLALEELGLPYETVLVDRTTDAQTSAAFRAINPAAKIPALETPDGPIFETAAILLWLSDRHGALAPAINTAERAMFLKWLFYMSNTLHANLRMTFYPDKYVGPDPSTQHALRQGARTNMVQSLSLLDDCATQGHAWFNAPDQVSMLDLYLCPMLRWMGLYPARDTAWFSFADWPALYALAARIECRPSVAALCAAEGLAPSPFTQPKAPNPPEGVAL